MERKLLANRLQRLSTLAKRLSRRFGAANLTIKNVGQLGQKESLFDPVRVKSICRGVRHCISAVDRDAQ